MASITFTFPDAIAPRLLNSFCAIRGYADEIRDPDNPGNVIQNPESKAAFAKRNIKEWILHEVTRYEVGLAATAAADAATQAVTTDINTNIVIT